MTSEEAMRLQKLWKSRHNDKLCIHSRVVDYLQSHSTQNAGSLVCRECGAIFPDPLKQLEQSSEFMMNQNHNIGHVDV